MGKASAPRRVWRTTESSLARTKSSKRRDLFVVSRQPVSGFLFDAGERTFMWPNEIEK